MILPNNYKEIYPCINRCGASSIIYASPDYTKAYKIYKKEFSYREEIFQQYLDFNHPNFLFPTDTVSIENNPSIIIVYQMDFDNGTALSKITDANLNRLITESLSISNSLKALSSSHLLIIDPNVDNITFGETFKFVDTYSYLLAIKYSSETIYQRNLRRVNDSILCGLIDFSYKKIIENYLRKTNYRYLYLFMDIIETKTQNENYVYEILSIIQETTGEEQLIKIKKRILETSK